MRLLIARLPRSVRHYATTSETVQGGNYTSALGQRHRADWHQFHFQRGIRPTELDSPIKPGNELQTIHF